MSDSITRALLARIMGSNRPTIALYPVVSGVPAVGATLTPGAGAWGVLADIVAAAAIVVDFWLLQFSYDTAGAATELFEIQVNNTTSAITVYEDAPDLTAVTANLGPTTPAFPIYCPANSQIQGRAGAAAATTLNVSVLTATGL